MRNLKTRIIVNLLAASAFTVNAILYFSEGRTSNAIIWSIGALCWIISTILLYKKSKKNKKM